MKITGKELTKLAKNFNDGSLTEELIKNNYGEEALQRVQTIAATLQLKDLGYLKTIKEKRNFYKSLKRTLNKIKNFFRIKRPHPYIIGTTKGHVERFRSLEVTDIEKDIKSSINIEVKKQAKEGKILGTVHKSVSQVRENTKL